MNDEIEQEALPELIRLKTAYQKFVQDNFESAAQDCRSCPTQGACCTDAHFVNVHITPLEAVAIIETLDQKLTEDEKQALSSQIAETIEKYNLNCESDTFAQTFACPLFVQKIGCLVHSKGTKPAPCIQHACYELQKDLPPQCLQDRAESQIEKLNQAVYGADWQWLPLPLQLMKFISDD